METVATGAVKCYDKKTLVPLIDKVRTTCTEYRELESNFVCLIWLLNKFLTEPLRLLFNISLHGIVFSENSLEGLWFAIMNHYVENIVEEQA